MELLLRIIILALGLFFFFDVFRMLTKRKLSEKNSIHWLVASLLVLVFSIVPKLLDSLAYLCGISYPPTLLFLIAIILLLFISFHSTIQISIMGDQIKQLTQFIAVNEIKQNPLDGLTAAQLKDIVQYIAATKSEHQSRI